MNNRWWIYQKERFPVFAHGPLILCFSASAMTFSMLLHGDALPRGAEGAGNPAAAAVARHWLPSLAMAFVTCFLFFLQLRIADEFKDFEEDTRYRPYRPVPRGLVRLRELGLVFAGGALAQLALALWLEPRLVILLGIAWAYLALMSVEFFARDWLVARPVTYLWTHMLIMPLVDLYATACHWLVAGHSLHPGLRWFLAVSFLNGVAIEMGRKLRASPDEEEGVRTYTALWGACRAPWIWVAVLAATGVCAAVAARGIDFAMPVAAALGTAWLGAVALALLVMQAPHQPGSGKRFETFTGLWTLALYLLLGPVPLLQRWMEG